MRWLARVPSADLDESIQSISDKRGWKTPELTRHRRLRARPPLARVLSVWLIDCCLFSRTSFVWFSKRQINRCNLSMLDVFPRNGAIRVDPVDCPLSGSCLHWSTWRPSWLGDESIQIFKISTDAASVDIRPLISDSKQPQSVRWRFKAINANSFPINSIPENRWKENSDGLNQSID